MVSNFLLGHLSVSSAARDALGRIPLDLICRHALNEHGDISAGIRKQNALAMQVAGRIVSRYPVDPTDPGKGRVYVITTESWDSTHVQLESET